MPGLPSLELPAGEATGHSRCPAAVPGAAIRAVRVVAAVMLVVVRPVSEPLVWVKAAETVPHRWASPAHVLPQYPEHHSVPVSLNHFQRPPARPAFPDQLSRPAPHQNGPRVVVFRALRGADRHPVTSNGPPLSSRDAFLHRPMSATASAQPLASATSGIRRHRAPVCLLHLPSAPPARAAGITPARTRDSIVAHRMWRRS